MTEAALVVVTPAWQLAARDKISALEHALRESIAIGEIELTIHDGTSEEGDDQAEHFFAEGVYGRGLWIPAGSLVIGRTHVQSRICVVAAGRCRWFDEYNPEPREVLAPWVGEFNPGSKTAVLALEPTYWLAFVGTQLTDPFEVLDTLSDPDYESYAKRLRGE